MSNDSGDEIRSGDLTVIGGGLVGLTVAILAATEAGAAVSLIDRAPAEAGGDEIGDPRTTAVSESSRRALSRAGVWSSLASAATPIMNIRVADGRSRAFVHLDAERDGGGEPLGWMLENGPIRAALRARAREVLGERFVGSTSVAAFVRRPDGIETLLTDGTRLTSRLLVGAEGRESAVRAWMGVPTRRHDFRQSAITLTVAHTRPHAGTALELFLRGGPLAVLPLSGDRSAIVWTEETARARRLAALPPNALAVELRARIGEWLGTINVVEGPHVHPLVGVRADRMSDRRVVLAGDAARTIHPVAGQGVNLGWRDAVALADIVAEALRDGRDPGDARATARYERRRFLDSLVTATACLGLVDLFSNELPVVRPLRRLGLALVEGTPAARRLLVRRAAGIDRAAAL